jgi:hypothetical protein
MEVEFTAVKGQADTITFIPSPVRFFIMPGTSGHAAGSNDQSPIFTHLPIPFDRARVSDELLKRVRCAVQGQ